MRPASLMRILLCRTERAWKRPALSPMKSFCRPAPTSPQNAIPRWRARRNWLVSSLRRKRPLRSFPSNGRNKALSFCTTMKANKFQKRLLLIMLVAVTANLACHPRKSANEKRYAIKGKVIAVDKSDRTATISHEDIVGYMPAMTMPFKIKNDADLEMMKPGDQITGTLVVDDLSSWIEITAIIEGGAPLTSTTVVPGEPTPGDDIPDFGLVNQDGKLIHLAQYRGKALALTFVYTRCPQPDQCTLMSNNFALIDQELQKQPGLYETTHL